MIDSVLFVMVEKLKFIISMRPAFSSQQFAVIPPGRDPAVFIVLFISYLKRIDVILL